MLLFRALPGEVVPLNPIDLLPMLLIFGVAYFLVLRPQMQEREEHKKLLESLARDDQVVTASGVHGKVVSVDTDTVVLEIAEKTKVTLDKHSVTRRQADPPKTT